MSQYYQLQKNDARACSFSGNGTVNSAAPSTPSAANAAASSCLANPDATFVPSAPSTTAKGGSGGAPTTTGVKNGAVPLVGDNNALAGMTVLGAVTILSVVWTLF
jgi:hypothetical protein